MCPLAMRTPRIAHAPSKGSGYLDMGVSSFLHESGAMNALGVEFPPWRPLVQEPLETLLTDGIMIPRPEALVEIETRSMISLTIITEGEIKHLNKLKHIIHRDGASYFNVA